MNVKRKRMKLTSIQKAEPLIISTHLEAISWVALAVDSLSSELICAVGIPAGRDIIDPKCDDYSRDKDSISKQTRHK